MIGNRSSVGTNSIEGDATATLNIDQSGAATYDVTQPFAGTVNQVATALPYIPSAVLDWSGTAPFSIQNALDRIASAIGPIA